MSLTVNSKTYTPDSIGLQAVVYAGPLHTVTKKDTMRLARTAPKPVPTNSGVGRSDAKLTRTLTLVGAVASLADARIDVNVDVPVGASDADVDAMIDDTAAFVASATFKEHVKKLRVNF